MLSKVKTAQVRNMCIWWDGTMRPMKGHMGNCRWKFDGYFWVHNPLPKIYDLTKGEQPIDGINITGVNKIIVHE